MDFKKKAVVLAGLLAITILLWIGASALTSGLRVVFFDVGQGDSILIQYNDRQILIDGGPNGAKLLEGLGREMPFWDRTIELVVLTHPDNDHLAGLVAVLERYRVLKILETNASKETKVFARWLKAKESEQAEEVLAASGQVMRLAPGLALAVLSAGREGLDTNDSAIVSKLTYKDKSLLFMADAGYVIENRLVRDGFDLEADILKAGHHGSKGASNPAFLQEVSPGAIIISSGRNNPYGHPHPETIERMKEYKVLRTDLLGDIKFKFKF